MRYEWQTKAVKRGGKIVTNTGEAYLFLQCMNGISNVQPQTSNGQDTCDGTVEIHMYLVSRANL